MSVMQTSHSTCHRLLYLMYFMKCIQTFVDLELVKSYMKDQNKFEILRAKVCYESKRRIGIISWQNFGRAL